MVAMTFAMARADMCPFAEGMNASRICTQCQFIEFEALQLRRQTLVVLNMHGSISSCPWEAAFDPLISPSTSCASLSARPCLSASSLLLLIDADGCGALAAAGSGAGIELGSSVFMSVGCATAAGILIIPRDHDIRLGPIAKYHDSHVCRYVLDALRKLNNVGNAHRLLIRGHVGSKGRNIALHA